MLRIMMVLCLSLLLAVTAYAEPTYAHKKAKSAHTTSANAKSLRGFPKVRPATGNHVFIFNPRTHAWAAYNENGERINTGRASGGRAFCRDIGRSCRTVVGNFHVLSKGDAFCISKIYPVPYGGARMPYCMRFHPSGYAIHGASYVPNYNASHGCIRVTTPAARWLNQNFIQNGTTVTVLPY
jgi:lipoprotein-anchoring transpeptidase ErfK/SrfK